MISLAVIGACQPKAETKTEEAAPPAPMASIEIVEPANGATVSSPVKFVLKATGVEIVAATDEREDVGHHHLLVDTDLPAAGDTIPRGVTGFLHLGKGGGEFTDSTRSIKPGRHRVIAVVGDHHHIPLARVATDTVEFTVK